MVAAVPGGGLAIAAEGLSRSYGRARAVDRVDLRIPRGEIFGIVGPDGAGKTTLIQMLCGILDPTEGRATVLGFDSVRDSARITERVGYMSQAFSLYGDLSVGENIRFFADIRRIPAERRHARAEKLLRFSRLAPFVDRLSRQLSGGMQKKLALATTLIHDPEILFLDEPTTGVDPISRREFWEIVFDFLREGVTIVVATPYMDEAERCSRLALMHEGRLLAVDSPDSLKSCLRGRLVAVATAADPAAALGALRSDPDVLEAAPFGRAVRALLRVGAAPDAVAERLTRSGVTGASLEAEEPGLEDVFVSLLGRPGRTGVRGSRGGSTGNSPAIEVRSVTRRFGAFTAVRDLSLTIGTGEVFGFLGPNGSGKTTTIRTMLGLLRPTSGSVRVAGLDVSREGRRLRPLVGYMSQRFSLYDDLSVEENLEFYAGAYGVPPAERSRRKAWALAAVGFPSEASTLVGALSGGWKQRVALASCILHRPRILLLDEPTSGVDPLSRRLMWDLVFDLASAGTTVLVTTHYMDEAERCDRLALLDAGSLITVGTPEELRAAVPGELLEIAVDRPLQALRAVRQAAGVQQVTIHGTRVRVLMVRADPVLLRTHLEKSGHAVRSMRAVELAMEDVFAALIERAKSRSGEHAA